VLDNSLDENFVYSLTLEQAKELCYHIRKNNICLSEELSIFYLKLQNFVYNSMTIDGAEKFFNEN
jgi:hypothetical protein